MPGLNDNHRRHLLLTFQHVDETLTRIFAAVREGKSDSPKTDAPFPAFKYDVTIDQGRLIAAYLRELRQAMARILRAHGITIPEPQISALWAFRSALMGVSTTIEELRPQYMAGYGPVDESAQADLQTISAELLNIIDQLGKSLAEPPGRDISARLRGLENANETVILAARLDEIITRRNLVEIRPALSALVERMEHAELEIAVFGRVSSGKSSLLNFLWQHNILPVGAVPITAIPTRLIHGDTIKVTVKIGTDHTTVIDPAQIEDFVTQSHNPDNRRQVTAVRIELPCSRIARGIAFVDTPGLGALGGQGAADALAYLPRCDIGLVLASAATGLTDLDIELVDALRRAGADIMVLLTKADLLTEHDRSAVLAYAKTQLRQFSDTPPRVHAVSVRPPQAQLTRDWFDRELSPLLDKAAAFRAASIHQKLQHLCGTAVDILKRREQAVEGSPLDRNDANVHTLLAQGTMILDTAGRLNPAGLPTARQLADEIISQTAQALAQGPLDAQGASDKFLAVAQAVAAHTANSIVLQLTSARDQAAMLRKMAAKELPNASAEELPLIAGLPVFDPTLFLADARIHAPAWTAISVSMRRQAIAGQLRELVQPRLEELLADYNKRLWQWRSDTLGELTSHHDAAAGLLRGFLAARPNNFDDAALAADIAALRCAPARPGPLTETPADSH